MTVVAASAVRTGGPSRLAGTGALLRLALRRDRVMIPVWALVVGGVVASGSGALGGLYDTAEKRAALMTSTAADSSLRALYGPVFSDSAGGLVAWRYGVFAAALSGVMSLLIVIRHTRDEEETGRQEMLSSAVVGRHAPLTAALLTALTANAAMALVITAGLSTRGGGGALAFGLAVAVTGMTFATAAAIVAQLTESARLARGLMAAVVGFAFVLRAAGDAGGGTSPASGAAGGSSTLTWLSPIGWAENVRPFAAAGERWWVALLPVGAMAVQSAAAYLLAGRRDLGIGLLPTRPGPVTGRVATAGRLAWRLQRGTLIGWSLGFLLAGIVFGRMTDGAADLVGDNEQAMEIFRRMGGQSSLTDAFLSAMVGMFGMVAALCTVASVLRLHGEETSQRAEPVLANAVGRCGWAAGHLVIAFGGAVLILLSGGLGLAIGHGGELPATVAACLVQAPAAWTIGSITLLFYGISAKAATAGWGAAGLVLVLGWIGPAVGLPRTVMGISPFGYLPKLPGPEMHWTPVVVLTLLSAALVAAALTALRRRDLTA